MQLEPQREPPPARGPFRMVEALRILLVGGLAVLVMTGVLVLGIMSMRHRYTMKVTAGANSLELVPTPTVPK